MFTADPDDPYRHDTLGRREQVERFCERVQATDTPVTWAVEGAWGLGKTAFSRMCAAVMAGEPGVASVIQFDALTQGATGAPLVDLAVAVGRGLELAAGEQTGESERRRRRSRLAELAEALSEPAALLREYGRGDAPAADAVAETACLLGEYVDLTPGLVVVWIDELDRCPPEYALGTLRAVRAICDHPGVATVLTVNPDALEEAVVRMHGELDGADRYLRRFIDLRVPLTAPGAEAFERSGNRLNFMTALWEDTPLARVLARAPLAGAALKSLAGDESLSLRDLEQIVHHAGIACAGLPPPPERLEEPSPGAPARGRGRVDPARASREAWADTITAAVVLGILRLASPETYREAAAQAWTSQKSAYEFFRRTLAEAGRSFGHGAAQWPADPLAEAIARTATRREEAGVPFETILESVELSGAAPRRGPVR